MLGVWTRSRTECMTAVEHLHHLYQDMTHLQVHLQVWEMAWADFLAHGYNDNDLALVLTHLLAENRRMKGARFSLRLNTLLDWQYERFDSLLSEARAVKRNRVVRSPRDQALSEFRRTPSTTQTQTAALPVSECIKKLKECL